MYRLKKDKRVLQSAALIREGLEKCLKTKPMADISVSEIAMASNVSRATFYRIFDTPIDVMVYVCDTLADEAYAHFKSLSPEMERKEKFIGTLKFTMNKSNVLELIHNSGRPELLHNSFVRMNEFFIPDPKLGLDPRESVYFRASHIAALCCILFVWMRKGKVETAEEIYSIYSKFVG